METHRADRTHLPRVVPQGCDEKLVPEWGAVRLVVHQAHACISAAGGAELDGTKQSISLENISQKTHQNPHLDICLQPTHRRGELSRPVLIRWPVAQIVSTTFMSAKKS